MPSKETWYRNISKLILQKFVRYVIYNISHKLLAATAAKSLQLCPTLCDPHRWQPTRLSRPWDSPDKNTGVGCHFLLQCMKVKSESEVAQSCPTLATRWTAAYQAPPSMRFSRQKYWSGVPLHWDDPKGWDGKGGGRVGWKVNAHPRNSCVWAHIAMSSSNFN